MSRFFLSQRIRLSIRTLVMIALLELMNEFGDEIVLMHWTIPENTFKIHIVKLGVALALAVPLILFWLFQEYRRLKRTDLELEQSQQDYRSLFDHNPDGVYLLDENGYFLNANPSFLELTGYSMDELKAMSRLEFSDASNRNEIAKHLYRAQHGESQRYQTGLTGNDKHHNLDLNITYFPMYRNGRLSGSYGIVQDVTAEKKLARDFEEMHSRFESLIQNTADAISILDLQGKVILVNPAWERLYGWKSEQVKDKIPPMLSQMFQRVLAHEQSFTEEQVKQRKDGSEITVSATGSPIYSSAGTITGVSFISKDLTEQKKAEEIIFNSEKLQLVASLAAGIAHEIRNPLTSVKGFLELMRTQFDMKYLDILQSEVHRINEITNEFLLLAKPQVQAQTVEDLAQVLQEVLTLMETQTHMHSVTVHVDTSKKTPNVLCVKTHIKQVFINIIKNAVEALVDGGNLYISFLPKDGGVSIQIVDDGPGMSEDTLGKVGQPFFTTKERGSGLGLMVTYRIVQNHGGNIHMNSIVGQGTRVQIYFPGNRSEQYRRTSITTAGAV